MAPNERIVVTFDELKDALSKDNKVTTVYLADDITMQLGGIKINPAKKDVIIDGINPYGPKQKDPYTLTDYNSATFTDTIYISEAGTDTVCMRNLRITGKNYYGPVSVLEAGALSNVVITFENVDYDGPQIGHHRLGLMRFIDCNVKIHGANGISANQEFSEAKDLIFEGDNKIETLTSNMSVFWHPYGGSFKIADDSSLSLTSLNTSTTFGLFYASGSSYDISIDIGKRAVFDVTLSGAFSAKANARLTSFRVQQGGAFRLNTTKNAPEAVLSVDGDLTVSEDAEFKMDGYGSPDYALLAQRNGDITIGKQATFQITAQNPYPRLVILYGKAFICNDPSSVLLFNANRDIEQSASSGRVYVNAQQINAWNSLKTSSLDNPPDFGWRKADKTNFWIDGILATGADGNFSSISSNYAQGDLPDMQPGADSFNMAKSRILAFGRLELIVTRPKVGSTKVSGVTAPGATVRLAFSQGGEDYTLPDLTVNSDGTFVIDTGVPLEASTVVNVKSNYQYLTESVDVETEGEGALQFTVPEKLSFFSAEISADAAPVKRLEPDWHIVISDTRGEGRQWSIYARLTKPLTPEDETKPILYGALVYANNSIVPLSPEGLMVYHHENTSDNEVKKLSWDEEHGILVQVPVGMAFSNIVYTATIEWSLVDGP